MKKSHLLSLSALLIMMAWGASASTEDFYEARMRAGKEAYRVRQIYEAIDELRIACFGFLDRPVLLSEGLARLSLAQAAAERTADADATLKRFIEVERRFAAYGKLKLEANIAADFQSLLLKRLQPDALLSLPSLAGLVETEEQKIWKLSPGQREKALEAASRRKPQEATWLLALTRDAAQRKDARETVKWSGKALELDPKNVEARALRAHALAERRQCGEALADFEQLPPEALQRWPELFADRLVCLVAQKNFAVAEQALQQVPANLLSLADVARAEQELAKESERKKKSASETRTTEKSSAVRAKATNRPSEPEKSGDGKFSIQQDPKPQELLGNGNSGSETSHPREGSGIPNRAESPGSLSAAAGEAASSAAGVLSEARRLLKLGRKSEAEKILREVLKAQPSRRELRLALLEVACLSRDWKTAAGQVSLVVPLKPGEVASMFYAAVVLYETGYPDRARPYMQRAKSWIQPSPYVDHYKEKILGRF